MSNKEVFDILNKALEDWTNKLNGQHTVYFGLCAYFAYQFRNKGLNYTEADDRTKVFMELYIEPYAHDRQLLNDGQPKAYYYGMSVGYLPERTEKRVELLKRAIKGLIEKERHELDTTFPTIQDIKP